MNQVALSSGFVTPFHERLQTLRTQIKGLALDGFLVPMSDKYLNEYIPPSDRRIEYLTGFTGSAAFLVILADRAAFFTDSRYTLQAENQVPLDLFAAFDIAQKTPAAWMKENLRAQMRIGFDPRMHSAKAIERYECVAVQTGARLIPTDTNPVDAIWTDRPETPVTPVLAHEASYAGKGSLLKRQEVAQTLRDKNINAAVLTDPASVAWLLNIRGNDVPHTPLPLSFAILRSDGTVEWYVDPRKVGKSIERHLGSDITIFHDKEFANGLRRLGEAKCKVQIDPEGSSFVFIDLLRQSGAQLELAEDPCALPRACKNSTEIDGMRAAHRRDGAAIVRLLAWVDNQIEASAKITEIDVETKLAALRAEGQLHRGPSFDTIAGSGPNGAIVHYRASPETNRPIDLDSFLLLDSGAQYLDGTTDITRTLPTGHLTNEMKDRYTRVLKGHIALAMVRFPAGTSGAELDVLARQYLWEAGLDYGHGTGHGVGCYLSVHEGPQSISRRGTTPLRTGMVLSNEPGFYKAKHYGIRLENLQYVVELFEISTTEMKMYGFETLTLAPFDRRAIVVEMLSKAERDWLNAYHARVNKTLRPQIDEATGKWLTQMTAPI